MKLRISFLGKILIPYIKELNLFIWRPKGLVDFEQFRKLLEEYVEAEKTKAHFHRFVDFSECKFSSNIAFSDIEQLHLLRKVHYQGPIIRSIYYVVNDQQFGIARIYQQLNVDALVQVEIYRTKEECATSLNIPVEVLFDPKYG